MWQLRDVTYHQLDTVSTVLSSFSFVRSLLVNILMSTNTKYMQVLEGFFWVWDEYFNNMVNVVSGQVKPLVCEVELFY